MISAGIVLLYLTIGGLFSLSAYDSQTEKQLESSTFILLWLIWPTVLWRMWKGPVRYEEQVAEFHKAFGVREDEPWEDHPAVEMFAEEIAMMATSMRACGTPASLRLSLILEETGELAEAAAGRDRLGMLDALCDLMYVVAGTVLMFGFGRVFPAAFAEVHRSNMSKMGADGRPVKSPAGKILKGPNYSPPQLERFIR